MSFKLYKKDTIVFEHDGSKIELDVQRLSAKDKMLFALKSSRVQAKIDDENTSEEDREKYALESIQMNIDILSRIVTDLRGVEDVDWPEDTEKRAEILNYDLDFLLACINAYSDSSKIEESTEKK